MRSYEFLAEGRNHPVICVDVQPNYDNQYSPAHGKSASPKMVRIMEFVEKQTGPILMFVNAEETGIADDTFESIKEYWDMTLCGLHNPEEYWVYDEDEGDYVERECDAEMNWNNPNLTIEDKGYGYLRAWMDQGVPENLIVKTIREMYQQKVNDTRMLFDGDDSQDYREQMNEFLGTDQYENLYDDNMSVEWTSIAQLKRFNGAYLVGGGREECLKEVALLMNAFNIKYKMIDDLIY